MIENNDSPLSLRAPVSTNEQAQIRYVLVRGIHQLYVQAGLEIVINGGAVYVRTP